MLTNPLGSKSDKRNIKNEIASWASCHTPVISATRKNKARRWQGQGLPGL